MKLLVIFAYLFALGSMKKYKSEDIDEEPYGESKGKIEPSVAVDGPLKIKVEKEPYDSKPKKGKGNEPKPNKTETDLESETETTTTTSTTPTTTGFNKVGKVCHARGSRGGDKGSSRG